MTISSKKIRILVVEDSAVARALLVHILDSDPGLQVIGTAGNGEEAIAVLGELKPDVITMDVHMPKMDGFETTRRIMETQPIPIVIVTASCDPGDVATSFRAMEAGAVAIIEKPVGYLDPGFAETHLKLTQTVKAMSEVRMVRRWPRTRQAAPKARADSSVPPPVQAPGTKIALVAIGVSTGGPPVLHTILAKLPKDFAAPILIVQHITEGFVQGLVDWLASSTGMPAHLAVQGQQPLPGHVYIAPDGVQMGVDARGRIALSAGARENGLRPSVSHLFRSVAATHGGRAIGILLTGMGRDGADELKLMKDAGAITIAQDQESSVVFGMPGEAVKIGAASHVLPPEQIASTLERLVKK